MFKNGKIEADLHIHSKYNDGREGVYKLAKMGKEAGLKALILTDHDTIQGFNEFAEACKKEGLESLTGVEISCTSGRCDQNIDILGYGFDLKEFKSQYSYLIRHNIETRRRWLARVLDLYRNDRVMNLTLKKIEKLFNLPARVSNKYWVMAARVKYLKKNGFKSPIGLMEFARRELKGGGLYYVSKDNYISPKDAVEAIKKCEGLAVWAHPSKTFEKLKKKGHRRVFENLLSDLASYGLDGLELNTPYLRDDKHLSEFIKACAKKYGIKIFTGGSDYHGEDGINESCYIGCAGVSYEEFLKLKKLCRKGG